jgi:hypothetical protein
MDQVADFGRSFLSWQTKESVQGRATAESMVSHINNTLGVNEEFIFSSAVIACYVLSDQKLVIEPSYAFRSFMSERAFKSFRSTASTGIRSDFGSTGKRYDFVRTHIERTSGLKLTNSQAVGQACNQRKGITGVLEMHSGSDAFRIEFPCKFVYYNARQDEFQIEAGPIPFPLNHSLSVPPDDWEACYIAFNSFENLEYVVESEPWLSKPGNRGSVPAKITLYSIL